ncbi:DUF4276 family protein [Sporomusa carbonis]|uniref:DUF4276 family protein n=1 Tax=Sporomusa carbonis TaxID=3076075 RepID=UPI003C7E754B
MKGKRIWTGSIATKLRAWREPGVRFIIVRDNDNAVCPAIKDRIYQACCDAGRPDTVVRLACQELESWYIGDLSALAKAYGVNGVDTPGNRKRYANPDGWQKPSVEVQRLIPAFQKLDGARRIAPHLLPGNNASHSFRIFLAGISRVAAEMGYDGGILYA